MSPAPPFVKHAEVALKSSNFDVLNPKAAAWLDQQDELGHIRQEFNIPTRRGVGADPALARAEQDPEDPSIYLCGNSLGAMPKQSRKLLMEELDTWADIAVDGHFDHPHDRPWMSYGDNLKSSMAAIVGALPSEVALMGGLTANLNSLMISFYRPIPKRFKILYEWKCFPSDQYAFENQVKLHGFTESEALIPLKPRQDEYTLRTEDILEAIKTHGDSIALVMFSGIQYYTGQFFEMEKITKAGHDVGAVVGWDLAHAVGNVPVKLHDWNVDFAAYCTYKYLNSSPGGLAGIFVHSIHTDNSKPRLPRLAGWFGHNRVKRFDMEPGFNPEGGAEGWVQSCTPALPMAALLGSLQVFDKAGGIEAVRRKSLIITSYMETLLKSSPYYVPTAADAPKDKPSFTFLTPEDPQRRGAQLSILFLPIGSGTMLQIFNGLKRRAVTGDKRKPDVIRLAPAPLYTSYTDVRNAFDALEASLAEVKLQT